MSYCTITQVQGHNAKRVYGASTTPTTTQVNEFISRIADEIDVVLSGRGMTTPITTPTSLVNFLSQVNAFGAASLAEDAQFPETSAPGMTPHARSLWDKYQQALKFLSEGALPSDESVVLPFSFLTEHAGDTEEPTNDNAWQDSAFGKHRDF